MQIRYGIIDTNITGKRISFSNEELLYMINNLNDSDPDFDEAKAAIKFFLEHILDLLNK